MIYVDELKIRDLYFNGKAILSCHLLTDGDESELIDFAGNIGVGSRHIHRGRKFTFYKLAASKRDQAIKNGAIEIDDKELIKKLMEG